VAHCSPRRKHRRLSPKSDNVLQNGRTVSVLYCVSCHDVCGRPKYHAVRLRVRLGSDKGIRRDQSTVQWWQTNYTDWWAAVTGAAASAAAADTSAGETGQITWQKLRLASRFHVTFSTSPRQQLRPRLASISAIASSFSQVDPSADLFFLYSAS